MKSGIFYDRQEDGSFRITDSWPRGNKYAQIQIDTDKPFGRYLLAEAFQILNEGNLKKQLKHDHYAILPFTIEPSPQVGSPAL